MSDNNNSNFIEQQIDDLVARGEAGADWRAAEILVEQAAQQALGDAYQVSPQDTRDYADGQRTRADLHVAERRPGGASVVVDVKLYSSTIPTAEVDKLVRDMKESRASGGVLIVRDPNLISGEAAAQAAANNIAIMPLNRNLKSNLERCVQSVIAASGVGTAPPDVRLNGDGSVDQRSAAVRDGSLLLTADGSVDRRSAVVRSGDVRVNNDGSVHAASRATHTQQTHTYAAPAPAAATTSSSVVDGRSAAVRSGAVLLTQSNAIDGRSAAVRSGEVRFTQDGSVDRRCSAVRSGALLLSSSSSTNSSSSSSSSGSSSAKSSGSSGGGSKSSGGGGGGGGSKSGGGGGGSRGGGKR